MNWAALRPAVMNTVESRSNFTASRNKLLLSAPHKPLSVLTRMTARFLTRRVSINGCLNAAMRGAASASTSFIKPA